MEKKGWTEDYLKGLKPEEKYDVAYQVEGYAKGPGIGYVQWTLDRVKFKTMLDVGCGVGLSMLAFILAGKLARGIEVSDYLLNNHLYSFSKLGLVNKGRIQELPFEDNSFDLVFCTDVLEHVVEEDVEKAIEELVRVSKKYILVSACYIEDEAMKSLAGIDLKLHETVKPEEWWLSKFNMFRIRKLKEALALVDGKWCTRADAKAWLFIKH